jgi:hypothetical protein
MESVWVSLIQCSSEAVQIQRAILSHRNIVPVVGMALGSSAWDRSEITDLRRDPVSRHCSGVLRFLRDNDMRKAHQPPYSPNLAPSDGYRFGQVTECLVGNFFAHAGKLLQTTWPVRNGIRNETLQVVFLDLMERLTECPVTNGDNLESTHDTIL